MEMLYKGACATEIYSSTENDLMNAQGVYEFFLVFEGCLLYSCVY